MATTPIPAARGSAGAEAIAALAGRLLIAAIFLWSGYGKVMNPDYNLAYIQSMSLPAPTLALWGAIFTELVGGFALAVGYRTRLVAAAMALFSLMTALIFHLDFSDPNQQIHFFKNLAIAGGILLLVAFGPGALAVDSRAIKTF